MYSGLYFFPRLFMISNDKSFMCLFALLSTKFSKVNSGFKLFFISFELFKLLFSISIVFGPILISILYFLFDIEFMLFSIIEK